MAQKIIWHLISNRWNSAITEYALSASRALEKLGYRNIFSPMLGSPAEKRAKDLNLETVSFHGFSLKNFPEIHKFSKTIECDAVLLYGGKETFLARFLGQKRLFRFLGQDLNKTLMRYPFLFSISYSHISKFILPNKILSEQITRLGSSKPQSCIYLGVEFLYSEQKSIKNEILILGRLDPVKGHKHALRFFSKMLEIWPQNVQAPQLHIIGEDANLSARELLSFAESLGLELNKNVLITNHRVPNVQERLSQSCLGLIPSVGSEHICRVAEEFLSLGTPIFVSGAGATEEALFAGAGVCYRNQEDEEIARQLKELVLKSIQEKPSDRRERAQQAREIFSLEAMGKNLEEFIFS